MRLYIQLIFLSTCKCFWRWGTTTMSSYDIGYNSPQTVPFVIEEPLGPKSNGPLHLDRFENMDYNEKPVQLNLEWQYESSTVKNDIRSVNQTQIEKYSTLRFIFETYNHDGWVLFG